MWNVDNLYKGYLIYLGMHNQGAAQMTGPAKTGFYARAKL